MPLVPTTWNPADKGAGVDLSGGNLVAASGYYTSSVRSVDGVSAGKWYWEVTANANAAYVMAGIGTASALVEHGSLGVYPGADANGWSYYGFDGSKYHDGAPAAFGPPLVVGDVLGFALDMAAGSLTIYLNGASLGVAFTGISGPVFAMMGSGASASCTVTANFGDSAFAYTPPVGFNHGLGTGSSAVYRLHINVKDAANNNVAREVAICRRSPFTLVGTVTTDAVTGNAVLETPTGDEHLAIALPASGENLNALVHDRILPALEDS